MADPIDSWRDVILSSGGWETPDGRICYPRSLVEAALQNAGRNFKVCGWDPAHDLEIMGTRVYFGGVSGTVNVLNIGARTYHESRLLDLYDQVRLEDALENLHFVLRTCIARDVEDNRDLDINTAYACIVGTTKHTATSFVAPEHVDAVVRMCDISLGGTGDGTRFRSRPFMEALVAFVVPPMRFAQESCHVIDAVIRNGMPVVVISAGQAGATAPVTLLGTLVQSNAELLAALTYINLVSPGYPTIIGNASLVSDLRSGAFVGGCSEMGLLAAAAAQLCQFYDLPSHVIAGVSSSKQPDAQAGWEKGYLTTLAALSGANFVCQAAGQVGDFMMSSYEALTMDNDMIGEVIRAVRGIEVSTDRLSLDQIKDVVRKGQGHFLTQPQTIALMESEYYYPKIADRQSLKDWQETGGKDMRDRAIERTMPILRQHFPTHIDSATDRKIRKEFNIYLAPEDMRSETSRWSSASPA